MDFNRRDFGKLALASVAVLADQGGARAATSTSPMPSGATDCHNHIVGPQSKYPMAANRTYTPPEASTAQLRALRTQLGVQRNVIVQPSFYGFDNSCLMDALADLGNSVRGIAVVPLDVPDTELKRLAASGVVGVRLNFATAGIRDPKTAEEALNAFGPRFVPLGWHIQVNTELPIIEAIAPVIGGLKVPVVFDHFGEAVAAEGISQKGFGALLELVRAGNTYVKLSAPYNLSKLPGYEDVTPLARALIAARADRMLWGTNWPHPGNREGRSVSEITPYQKVDNLRLVKAFQEWCPDGAIRKMILVDTPTRLYRFT